MLLTNSDAFPKAQRIFFFPLDGKHRWETKCLTHFGGTEGFVAVWRRAVGLQVLSEQCPSQSATNVSTENLNLESQQPRDRGYIVLNPSNFCTDGALPEFP